MTMTGLDTFDTSVQKSDVWLKEIMHKLHWDSRHQAYQALRTVLHILRDRLTIDEAADLGAQLPMVIRGIYYDEWKPSRSPSKIRSRDQFLEKVHQDFKGYQDIDAEELTRAVFQVIRSRVTEGEIEDVEGMLPEELRELWQ
ncbi:MAG: DUF2267 domain-containing protein [Chitinivibrionales bacterium]